MVALLKPYLWTVGRRCEEKADVLITDPYLNDYNKILQSKAYRRLTSKTQVIYRPGSPHVRNRRVHTDEVISVAMAIATQLSLNANMSIAIAAGHDIGHTPGGHLGESVLTKRLRQERDQLFGKLGEEGLPLYLKDEKLKFKHYVNSVVVAQQIERRGAGLNLCFETLEGILNHSRGEGAMTLAEGKPEEYNVVMFSDKIAYTFSDVNDAIRVGILDGVPSIVREFGKIQRDWNNTALLALIDESREKGRVEFSESHVAKRFAELRDWMYQNVYKNIDDEFQELALQKTYDFFEQRQEEFETHPALLVSLMTDEELYFMAQHFMKQCVPTIGEMKKFGVLEILPYIKGRDINFMTPDLSWEKEAIR